MLTFLIYAFFITGTVSFLAELVWRVTHWKEKKEVINCTIKSDSKTFSKEDFDKLLEKFQEGIDKNIRNLK